MKKMIFIITVATTFMFFGCQATPEKPIVIGKDLDKMIESAVREGVDTNPITEVNVAERYVKTIVNKKGNCTVNIDAELLVPEVDSIPIYRVSKQEFTKEMVDRLLKAFFDDRELYEVFSFQQKTKSQIQDEIIQLENELANLDPGSKSRYPVKNLEDIKSLDDLPEEVLKLGIGNDIILQLYINNLKEAYKTAPDNPPPPIPFAGEFRKMSDSVSDFRIMHAAPKPVDDRYESLIFMNSKETNVDSVCYTNEKGYFEEGFGDYSPLDTLIQLGLEEISFDVQITEEEAIRKAEDLLKKAGIDDMTLWSAERAYGGSRTMGSIHAGQIGNKAPRRCVYLLKYVREIDGVPLTDTSAGGTEPDESLKGSNYAAGWAYEEMNFAVDDRGIVEFEWTNPYHMEDKITDNTNMISLEDAKNIFEKMFFVTSPYAVVIEDDVTIDINKIVLGLMRVTEQNKRDSGLLVPVWDFFGFLTIDGESYDKNDSFLTINAIDGSIIDRELGY